MTTPDDLPWPELGNVSRGATRGNQGQKGVLGPADHEGRCALQLRVQPGVLEVRLNRQASDWYRTLDNEVNRALKLTKTYWRKARRRQDYDARADQDHMELHEWLQQLKDKTMSHLELLMQKGDIQGPPYLMGDDLELTFLRKFIERQNAGVAHNPRLRNVGEAPYAYRDPSTGSASPEPSDHSHGYLEPQTQQLMGMDPNDTAPHLASSHHAGSPMRTPPDSLSHEAASSKQALQICRTTLARTQKDTQDAFLRYTACLEAERQARQAVAAAEKRRDDIMATLLSMNQPIPGQSSRPSSVPLEEHHSMRYASEMHPEIKPRSAAKMMEWADDGHGVYATDQISHMDERNMGRKHSRSWEAGPQMADVHYGIEDLGLPPRKRMQHMMPGYDVLSTPLIHGTNMALHS